MERKINICRPGFGASCALCCGSHNYLSGCENMEVMFSQRRSLVGYFCSGGVHVLQNREALFTLQRQLEDRSLPWHLEDAIRCPFVGFVDHEETQLGCLIYGEGGSDPRVLHMSTICGTFSCLSREILSDDEILFAARLTGDWYYYSLLINDITMLRELISLYSSPELVSADALEQARSTLEKKLFNPAD
ncbi:MAG: hypothetical protein ACOCWZ_00275 [Spirochaetota bacterium]